MPIRVKELLTDYWAKGECSRLVVSTPECPLKSHRKYFQGTESDGVVQTYSPSIRKAKAEDHKVEARLLYKASLRPSWKAGSHASGLKPSITPVAGDLLCSSDLQGHLEPTWCTYLHTGKTICTYFFNLERKEKEQRKEIYIYLKKERQREK